MNITLFVCLFLKKGGRLTRSVIAQELRVNVRCYSECTDEIALGLKMIKINITAIVQVSQ